MSIFPRVILRWKEPKIPQTAGSREDKRSLIRMISMSVLAGLPVIWLMHRLSPGAAGRAVMALAAIIFFMCFVFWVYRVFPSWVTVTDRGISQSVTSEDEQTWKFEAIRHCAIRTICAGGRPIRQLIIVTRKGDHAAVAIADSISTGELEAVLTAKGVKVIKPSETVPDGA